MEPSKEDIAKTVTRIADEYVRELERMTRPGLETAWHFQWSEMLSLEDNTYRFYRALDLYGRVCRRWEEMHNGPSCVVERVRDRYLMPKIYEFSARIRQSVVR